MKIFRCKVILNYKQLMQEMLHRMKKIVQCNKFDTH